MNESKRRISVFIPFQNSGSELRVYLQKRSADAEALPGNFGFWGGHAEKDEAPEEALAREIQEEMGISLDLRLVHYFDHYEFIRNIKDVYLLEVTDHWEDQIVIGEGDYGKWFLTSEVFDRQDIIFEDKVVINDLERLILKMPIR